MHPLLTLSAGILAGVAAVRWLKDDKTRAGLDAVQEQLREAAASGRQKAGSGLDAAQHTLRDAAIASLSAVESSSARLRTRLTPASAAPQAVAPEAPTPARKTRRAPRKTAANATAAKATKATKSGKAKS